MPELERKCVDKMKGILSKEYMSSEESEYEEVEQNGVITRKFKCYRIRRLSWERKKLKKMKERMDTAYMNSLSNHAKGMIKQREDGETSSRPCPPGPSWAVKESDN